jgi:hypothetical protein
MYSRHARSRESFARSLKSFGARQHSGDVGGRCKLTARFGWKARTTSPKFLVSAKARDSQRSVGFPSYLVLSLLSPGFLRVARLHLT